VSSRGGGGGSRAPGPRTVGRAAAGFPVGGSRRARRQPYRCRACDLQRVRIVFPEVISVFWVGALDRYRMCATSRLRSHQSRHEHYKKANPSKVSHRMGTYNERSTFSQWMFAGEQDLCPTSGARTSATTDDQTVAIVTV